ncbi:MAG: GxxExxY protein [Bacteroidales bacterium]|nr:GxxExxY protein [Bacteroidales bacterium]
MVDVNRLKAFEYDVVGAIYAVHQELGPGLNESCYQEGLQMELTERGIPFVREMSFHPSYRGKTMESLFKLDFLCKDNIIIECKAVPELKSIHRAQLFNYMRLLKTSCGILVNFLPNSIDPERYFFDKEKNQIIGVRGQVFYEK